MSTATQCDVGVLGLGVMGSHLARNFASRGFRVAGYEQDVQRGRALAAEHPEARLVVTETLQQFVSALQPPRRIIVLVPAQVVDAVLESLDPLLEADDVVVDAGNSLFSDTDRRVAWVDDRPWRFVGMGVSGGAQGALEGPSMMPGGDVEAWQRLRGVLEPSAAVSEHGACVTHCGRGSAGHFVKMVHNGIEYGDMQLITETATLLRAGLGRTPAQVAEVFAEWNQGDLDSYLIEITAAIFRTPDPGDDGLLLDRIVDRAGQKGTGRWTVKAALDLGIAVPTISAAVDARAMSALKETRVAAEAAFGRPEAALEGVSADDLRDALYASKIASYTQGFELLRAGDAERDYGIDLAEIARIWTGGCIIRARLLGRIREALAQAPGVPLALTPVFRADLDRRLRPWRKVVSAATAAGVAIPGLAASATWFESLTTARGSADLIQAQRDYFGSHTYERIDDPGVAHHTEW